MNKKYDLVIIGGGSAGMAAASAADEAGINKILIIEKDRFLGGILLQCIHNGFGLREFKEELTGPEYAERCVKAIRKQKIECLTETTVTAIEKDGKSDDIKVVYSGPVSGYDAVIAKAVICATGCSERTRGAINIPGTRPAGIITAGSAQRYLNIDGYPIGKRIFILGSGDIGLIMARRLKLEGAEVLGVAELMPYSNGLQRNIVQCLEDFGIPLYLRHTVKEIIGKDRLERIIIAPVDDDLRFISGHDLSFDVDTLLLSVGLLPNNPLLEKIGVRIHPKTKGPIVDEHFCTSVPGIFACGNSLHVHDLVDFASAEGKEAGKNAAAYIRGHSEEGRKILIEAGDGIAYILPESTHTATYSQTSLKLRVKEPLGKTDIVLKLNGSLIKRIRKPYLLPAEMVIIPLKNTVIEDNNGETLILTAETEKCGN